jgi:hypothetical protein
MINWLWPLLGLLNAFLNSSSTSSKTGLNNQLVWELPNKNN